MVYLCNCQIKIHQYFINNYYAWGSLTEPQNKIISIAKVIWGRQPTTNFNSHQYFQLYNILFCECDIRVFVHPMKLTKAPPTLHQPRATEMVAVVYRLLRNPPPGAHSCPETCYQGQPLWNVCTKMQAM